MKTKPACHDIVWSWGDGKKDDSFFPASHTYADRTATYTVTVTAHYPGNYTATAKTVVGFKQGSACFTK